MLKLAKDMHSPAIFDQNWTLLLHYIFDKFDDFMSLLPQQYVHQWKFPVRHHQIPHHQAVMVTLQSQSMHPGNCIIMGEHCITWKFYFSHGKYLNTAPLYGFPSEICYDPTMVQELKRDTPGLQPTAVAASCSNRGPRQAHSCSTDYLSPSHVHHTSFSQHQGEKTEVSGPSGSANHLVIPLGRALITLLLVLDPLLPPPRVVWGSCVQFSATLCVFDIQAQLCSLQETVARLAPAPMPAVAPFCVEDPSTLSQGSRYGLSLYSISTGLFYGGALTFTSLPQGWPYRQLVIHWSQSPPTRDPFSRSELSRVATDHIEKMYEQDCRVFAPCPPPLPPIRYPKVAEEDRSKRDLQSQWDCNDFVAARSLIHLEAIIASALSSMEGE